MDTSQPTAPVPMQPMQPMQPQSAIGQTLAAGGRIYAVMGAIICVIVMIIMVSIGAALLRDKHTASANMAVVGAPVCTRQTTTDNKGNTSVNYVCSALVTFPVNGRAVTSPHPVTVKSPVPLTAGATVSLRYDPNNPIDIVQEASPRAAGWALIGSGVALGALSVASAVLTFRSPGYAEFAGAAGLIGALRR